MSGIDPCGESPLVDSAVNSFLLHVHVCVHCKASFRREEMEGRVHTTGLFVCTKCGSEGPLNVEIHEVKEGE